MGKVNSMTKQNIKIILLNGPGRSGKDTAANFLEENYNSSDYVGYLAHKIKFASPLKNATHKLFGLDVEEDHFEDTKEEPMDCFNGMSPRQAYIHVDKILKGMFGEAYLGTIMVNRMDLFCEGTRHNVFFVSDCGFVREADPLIESFGKENLLLVRLYRDGYTFKGDSRDYIMLDGVKMVTVNNKYLPTFKKDLKDRVDSWLYHRLKYA